MSSPLTAVAQWVQALTIDGVEPPTGANWLPILQSHADRQQFLFNAAIRSLTSIDSNTVLYDACWDPTKGRLVAVGATGGSAPSSDLIGNGVAVQSLPSSGDLTSLTTIATDGAGTLVAGGSVSTSTAAKARTSTDGGESWTNRSFSASNDHDVKSIIYFNSLYVAFLGDGTGTATIQSSPDGTTWTARTNPASNADWIPTRNGGTATDGTTLVSVQEDSANAVVYTTNGTTFSTATTTATTIWRGVAYTPKFGWVLVNANGSTINQSSDGQTWSAATTATLPAALSSMRALNSIGDVYVMSWLDGDSKSRLSYSADGCATWVHVAVDTGDNFLSLAATYGKLVWFGDSSEMRVLISSL